MSDGFLHGGHLGKKVDEDAPGTGPMLHRENRVKIRCRLGGEGGRTHTHTHTQDSEKSPEFTPNGPLQAMNGCVGISIISNPCQNFSNGFASEIKLKCKYQVI